MRKYIGIVGALALLFCFAIVVKSGVEKTKAKHHPTTLASQSKTDTAALEKARTITGENEEIVAALAKMNRSFEGLAEKTNRLNAELNKVAEAIEPNKAESRTTSSPTQR